MVKNLNLLLKLAGRYEFFARAVPLDYLDILPSSDFYNAVSPEQDPEATRVSRNIPKGPIIGNQWVLPSLVQFKKHYANTDIKFRIIYSKFNFGLGGDLNDMLEPDLQEFKQMLESNLSDLRQGLKVSWVSESFRDQCLKDIEVLLENYDQIFKSDAINIIANRYEIDDLVGPLGVDHDLGHRVLGLGDMGKDSFAGESSYKNYREKITQALEQDYEFKMVERGTGNLLDLEAGAYHTSIEAVRNNLDQVFRTDITAIFNFILISNNLVEGSIGEMNLKKNDTSDLLPELLNQYHLGGKSLSGLRIKGVPFYLHRGGFYPRMPISLEAYNDELRHGTIYAAVPKQDSLPHVEKELKEILPRIENLIGAGLSELVGKVVCLW